MKRFFSGYPSWEDYMNPQAFQIIESLGLRHPEFYRIEEAIDSKHNKFYLRYNKGANCQSRVVDKEELITRRMDFEMDFETGRLLKIEDSFDSVAGCAVYIDSEGIYGEYVEGHIVALLRKGICKKRFFIDSNKNVAIKDAFQGFEAIQIKGGYLWEPCTDEKNTQKKLNKIINYLLKNILGGQEDLLLEILITEDEIVVCDAKHPGMKALWQGMKNIFNTENRYLKNKCLDDFFEKEVKIDGFDIDLSKPVKDIIVGNGAILNNTF